MLLRRSFIDEMGIRLEIPEQGCDMKLIKTFMSNAGRRKWLDQTSEAAKQLVLIAGKRLLAESRSGLPSAVPTAAEVRAHEALAATVSAGMALTMATTAVRYGASTGMGSAGAFITKQRWYKDLTKGPPPDYEAAAEASAEATTNNHDEAAPVELVDGPLPPPSSTALAAIPPAPALPPPGAVGSKVKKPSLMRAPFSAAKSAALSLTSWRSTATSDSGSGAGAISSTRQAREPAAAPIPGSAGGYGKLEALVEAPEDDVDEHADNSGLGAGSPAAAFAPGSAPSPSLSPVRRTLDAMPAPSQHALEHLAPREESEPDEHLENARQMLGMPPKIDEHLNFARALLGMAPASPPMSSMSTQRTDEDARRKLGQELLSA